MIENLRLLNDTLARSPLAGRWWMFAGGLLGWAREGNVLLHDSVDVDFLVLDEDIPRLHASIDLLRRAGFQPLFRFPGVGRPTTIFSFLRDGAKFEFMRAERRGEVFSFWSYGPGRGGGIANRHELPAQPLVEFRYLDRTWLKTRDHDLELTASYGDWRTPDPAFTYMDSPAIVERVPWDDTSFDAWGRAFLEEAAA
jgi:hypothetical protein